jgi:hypothetical protein
MLVFVDVDLSTAIGLENVRHHGPSTIGIDTIYASEGKIPEVFLRGFGDFKKAQIPTTLKSYSIYTRPYLFVRFRIGRIYSAYNTKALEFGNGPRLRIDAICVVCDLTMFYFEH